MGKSWSMSRSFCSFATESSLTAVAAAARTAALGETLPLRAALRPVDFVLPAGLSALHVFLALMPLPFGLPRLAVVFTDITPRTFPLASPATAGSKPRDLSLASFFPSAHTDLSSSFLRSQANKFLF